MSVDSKQAAEMQTAQPADETARKAALDHYRILDTLPEAVYNDLVRIASEICQTPIALMSLIDSDRQWFKARVGMEAQQTSRDIAFCAHAILAPGEVMQVPDALLDERFANNPLVTGESAIRFYAGVPLVTSEGHAIGTLCAIDRRPRQLTESQVQALKALSRLAMIQLELRRSIAALQAAPDAATSSTPTDTQDRIRELTERMRQLQNPDGAAPV